MPNYCVCNPEYTCSRHERERERDALRAKAIELAEYYWQGMVAVTEHHSRVQLAMLRDKHPNPETNLRLHHIADALFKNWQAWAKVIDHAA